MAKKVGSAAEYIIPIGLLGLVAFALYKSGILTGTFTGTGGNNQKTADTTTTVANAAYTASSQTTPQSIPDTTLNSMINSMWSDWYSSTSIFAGSSYGDDIVSQMSQLTNITDVYRIIQLFGTRAMPPNGFNLCNAIDVDCPQVDFGTFLKTALSTSQLATVNSDLAGNGIDYQFY